MTAHDNRIVVMGVAGSGKTAVGTLVADRLGLRFVDGDSLHPPENVARMEAGIALTDADRWPWLEAVAEVLREPDQVVVACSALRRSYRDVLRRAGTVVFVFLDLDPATALGRLSSREGHFMGPGMSEGQFRTLERPMPDEWDVLVIDATPSLEAVVDAVVAAL